MSPMPACDILIITYNQMDYTRSCLQSIKENTSGNYRVIVVDNASNDGSREYLAGLAARGEIRLIQNRDNRGWVDGVNIGIAASKSDYLCVMNNDTLVYPGWLEEMISVAEKDASVGLVNPQWVLPKYYRGPRDDYARRLRMTLHGRAIETDWARGFCYLIKRAVIEAIGGLDAEYSPGYYDDRDFSMRATDAGFKCVVAEGAFVWHHKNISFESHFGRESINSLLAEKGRIFQRKWGKQLNILAVLDTGLTGDTILPEIRIWLKKQHRVLIVGKGNTGGLRHTNLKHKKWLFPFPSAVLFLLDNHRHSRAKHFDAIICSENMRALLRQISFVRNGYRMITPGKNAQSHSLTEALSGLSEEKA